MVRPRFGFVLLVSFSTFVAAQFEEAAGDFGSGEYPPSSPPPPSPPPRPPWAPILCGAAGQPPCGRLVASGPNLLLDGAPFVARGVAYNPTPAGADRADYLADGNAAIWEKRRNSGLSSKDSRDSGAAAGSGSGCPRGTRRLPEHRVDRAAHDQRIKVAEDAHVGPERLVHAREHALLLSGLRRDEQ